MRAIACISLWALLSAVACDKTTTPLFQSSEQPSHSIRYLKSLCQGTSYAVREEINIRGSVTAGDLYGEFYKTLVIEDPSGGIVLAADHTALADDYPVGCEVLIHCNGLTLCDYGGKIVLGTTPDEQGAGRIDRDELPRYLHRVTPGGNRRRPAVLSFDEIDPDRIDTYVRFDRVHFSQPTDWCALDPETGERLTTERTICDDRGRTFTVRTLGSCHYASEPVPTGTGSLCGIIDYFGGKYTLRVINREVEFRTEGRSKAYL